MKKQYTLWLLLALSLNLTVHAQDIDRQGVNIAYVLLPLKKLPDGIETYSVAHKSIETNWGNTLGHVYDVDKWEMNGFHKLDKGGDIEISLIPEMGLVFDRVNLEKGEFTYKEKKDSPEIKYMAYTYSIYYYLPKVKCEIKDKAGNIVDEQTFGGVIKRNYYGSTDYKSAYRSETALSNAWANQKRSYLASAEKSSYDESVKSLPVVFTQYCMWPRIVDFKVRYVDEKKTNLYSDYREAKDLFIQGTGYAATDHVEKLDKLIQPDYEKRKETLKQAIAIWEKALTEADYDNKKARVDAKVARNTYYNLALAYLWIDDFARAKEYLQGRKDDVGRWDRNFLAGIKDLSNFIDMQEQRCQANTWRTFLAANETPYVYKTPEEKAAEQQTALAKEKAAQAAASKAKPKTTAAKPTTTPKQTSNTATAKPK